MTIRLLPVLVVATLGACATPDTPEPKYGPEVSMQGDHFANFEMEHFNGCDVRWTEPAGQQLEALVGKLPPSDDIARGRALRLSIIGKRSIGNRPKGRGYGYMQHWPCRIMIMRVVAARELPLP